jgi:hypothetical protein
MGAKAWMLVYTNLEEPLVLSRYGDLDRDLSEQLAKRAFPKQTLQPIEDLTLCDVCPPDGEVLAGCFAKVSFLSAAEFAPDRPSTLESRFVNLANSKRTYLFAMHSVVDFFAFGVWENGKLRRAFSASSDSGVIEDIGEKYDFEVPYWNGEHRLEDWDDDEDYDQPMAFHPLEFGEDALRYFLGFGFEGPMPADGLDPFDFSLLAFERKQALPFWKRFLSK